MLVFFLAVDVLRPDGGYRHDAADIRLVGLVRATLVLHDVRKRLIRLFSAKDVEQLATAAVKTVDGRSRGVDVDKWLSVWGCKRENDGMFDSGFIDFQPLLVSA